LHDGKDIRSFVRDLPRSIALHAQERLVGIRILFAEPRNDIKERPLVNDGHLKVLPLGLIGQSKHPKRAHPPPIPAKLPQVDFQCRAALDLVQLWTC
jgi:hypothetical protein